MDENLIVESLSPMERTVLPVLSRGEAEVEDIVKNANLDKTTVLRAVGLLEKKGLVKA
jgi:predicted transcriptional regulator